METEPRTSTTAGLLLDTLRAATGRADLEFSGAPTALTGGYYAEMVRFRLVAPPAGLDGDLVARIVPDPRVGEWEATVQRNVASQGFPTPAVRLTAPDTSPLGRYLIVMDHVDGRPPLAGLRLGSMVGQVPDLMRHLPDQLAGIAAHLHSLDPEPLVAELEALDGTIPTTTAGFVAWQSGRAGALRRPDLAVAGERLLVTEPPSSVRVIAHGDLHPFNLLIGPGGPALVDWTIARVAHPAFTIGFTELMLSNPPIALPRAANAMLRPLGRNIGRRFVATYRRLTVGSAGEVDDDDLSWHRRVHALRILVELARWDAEGTRPTAGHPWLVLEPVARRTLDLQP